MSTNASNDAGIESQSEASEHENLSPERTLQSNPNSEPESEPELESEPKPKQEPKEDQENEAEIESNLESDPKQPQEKEEENTLEVEFEPHSEPEESNIEFNDDDALITTKQEILPVNKQSEKEEYEPESELESELEPKQEPKENQENEVKNEPDPESEPKQAQENKEEINPQEKFESHPVPEESNIEFYADDTLKTSKEEILPLNKQPEKEEVIIPENATIFFIDDKTKPNIENHCTNEEFKQENSIIIEEKTIADTDPNKEEINIQSEQQSNTEECMHTSANISPDKNINKNEFILQSPTQIEIENPNGFPLDFNWEMHNKNHSLLEENQHLNASLMQKNKEICSLEDALTTLHEELNFMESQELQIVAKDLAKRNRRLTVQLERERSKIANIKIANEKLKINLKQYMFHNLSPKKLIQPLSYSDRPVTTMDADDDKINKKRASKEELLNTKYIQLNHRFLDVKNSLLKYKDLNAKLKISLKKEIGDGSRINSILSENAPWKGRAERICILEAKLKKARKESEKNRNRLENKNAYNTESSHTINEQHKYRISNLATIRAKEYQNIQKENQALMQYCTELKNKIVSKNSRILILENDALNVKKKLAFFVQKSSSDNKLIETFEKQMKEYMKYKKLYIKYESEMGENRNEVLTLRETIELQSEKLFASYKKTSEMEEIIDNLSERRNIKIHDLFTNYMNNENAYERKILQSENIKCKEMIEIYKKNVANLQKRLSRKSSANSYSSEFCTNSRSNKNCRSTNSKILRMREKLDALTQEQQLMKASFLIIIDGKEQEIRICREMLSDQMLLHEKSIEELHKEVKSIKKCLLP